MDTITADNIVILSLIIGFISLIFGIISTLLAIHFYRENKILTERLKKEI